MSHNKHPKSGHIKHSTKEHLDPVKDKLLQALSTFAPSLKEIDEETREFTGTGILALVEENFTDEEIKEIGEFFVKYENRFWNLFWAIIASLDYGIADTGLDTHRPEGAAPDLNNFPL